MSNEPKYEALRLVVEARRLWGKTVAQELWRELGLPVVPAMLLLPCKHVTAND